MSYVSHTKKQCFIRRIRQISWKTRPSGVAKFRLKEMGSRYLFICIYIRVEKYFSCGDYRKNVCVPIMKNGRDRLQLPRQFHHLPWMNRTNTQPEQWNQACIF
jgi:hypothetical protein